MCRAAWCSLAFAHRHTPRDTLATDPPGSGRGHNRASPGQLVSHQLPFRPRGSSHLQLAAHRLHDGQDDDGPHSVGDKGGRTQHQRTEHGRHSPQPQIPHLRSTASSATDAAVCPWTLHWGWDSESTSSNCPAGRLLACLLLARKLRPASAPYKLQLRHSGLCCRESMCAMSAQSLAPSACDPQPCKRPLCTLAHTVAGAAPDQAGSRDH